MSLPYLEPPLPTFHAPQFKNPGSRENLEVFWILHYKSEFDNRLAGIYQPAKGEER